MSFSYCSISTSPVDGAEAALGEERDLLELGAVAGVVVEGALGRRRRPQVGDALWQVGAVHLPQTHVTLEGSIFLLEQP